jgi:ABC-type Fe3+ transport system permease subunit
MGLLAWVMMGLALWHYAIFLPDRFWGGIVGAFLVSIAGAVVSGLLIFALAHGVLVIPGRHATHLVTVLYAIPGAIAAMAALYVFGGIREHRSGAAVQ